MRRIKTYVLTANRLCSL